MMPTMEGFHLGPPPHRVTLWAGPADGQPWDVGQRYDGGPDIEVPLRSQTLPGVVPATDWKPTQLVAIYRYNATRDRYEYVGQETK